MKPRFFILILCCAILTQQAAAQSNLPAEKTSLQYNLNEEGTHYFKATFMNQTWLRYNQNNPGTKENDEPKTDNFGVGLRRTRIQLYGQLTDKVFLYFQFGQNNFNAVYNSSGNRKIAAFFHDALCEYKLSRGNQLKIGAGLTVANGLSRFSQPSVGTIMTMDVPVFAQSTVDQTDEFNRKLSLYARGQISHFDYRILISDPFPISSNGAPVPPISTNATFNSRSTNKQYSGYFIWQFLEHESHLTPYMTGTYLGSKKVLNLAAGFIFQKDAMWRLNNAADTATENLRHLAVEAFLDMPLHAGTGDAISAYAGYFNTNYGSNYLRYNGLMNPANGTTLTAQNSITGQGPTFGNALPMFGTGSVVYAQAGYLLPKNLEVGKGKLMPYASATLAKFDRLQGLPTNSWNAGVNYFIKGHSAKLSIDWQNRPTYLVINANTVVKSERKNAFTVQYQIAF